MSGQPLVTVVVPTRDAARTLAACLGSVRAQSYPAVELVVVDNGSTDGTVAIATVLADRVESWGPERSAQRNRGWRVGRGELVVFVDADMVLEPGVVAEAVAACTADAGLGALIIPESAFGVGFLARCRVLEKRLYEADGHAEAARAFPRRVLAEVGGYAEELSAFEDWELTDRVLAAGHRLGRVSARTWHDEGRISLRRAYAKKRYYGRWLPAYRSLRPATAGRGRLARPALLGHPLLLARAPHRAAGLFVLKAVEWTGLAVGARTARGGGRR